MPEHREAVIVGICSGHAACESAVHGLHEGRFDLARVSVVARDSESAKRVTDLGADTRVEHRNATPPFWAGFWRLLPRAGFLWVPGTGSLFVGGPLLTEIIASRDRRRLDRRFSAVGRGLHALGLSRDAIGRYERAIDSNNDLIIVPGSESEVDQARTLLQSRDAVLVARHSARNPWVLAPA
jgi:hypothetical protein